ncbi:MAG: glycoside hydrolase family 5 protein [Pseudomonadales bacterium]
MENTVSRIDAKKALQAVAVALIFIMSLGVKATVTPVEQHGQLSILDGQLVGSNSQKVSLAGPSLFWSNNGWPGAKYYTAQTVEFFATQWNASIIRAAMAAQGEGSYLTDPEDNRRRVETVVDAAIDNGIYVIIDWHSHHAEQNVDRAVAFFTAMAAKYGQSPNVIYEIYNEPLRETDWHTVIKPYSQKLIAAIRAIDSDNIILVGTQSWSQDVDLAAQDPLKEVDNIAYSLHFYAGTHKADLREKAQVALDAGLALFVSEWGTVDATGDGDIDRESTEQWLEFMRDNSLSHCTWSVVNKNEKSAILKPKTVSGAPWKQDDLTENGLYLKEIISQWSAEVSIIE